MGKSSKSVTLALIGTASVALIGSGLLLNGCGSGEEEGQQAQEGTERNVAGHHAGGVFIAPRLGGGFGGGRGGVAPAPSARGGFGATGSASVGS